ncbi:MAG: CRISPR-associated helicase Cas3' [Litorilinea sp.]
MTIPWVIADSTIEPVPVYVAARIAQCIPNNYTQIAILECKMPRIPEGTRVRNIETVWLRVRRHPDGITEAEIAKMTGIGRRSVNNYLVHLSDEGRVEKEGTLWFPLEYEETRLRAIDLSPEEAYALYLGSRLLTKQHDKRNEPAETALLKLAQVLTSDAGVGQEIAQAATLLAQRPTRPGYQSVFTTLTRGYIYRRTVEVVYRPLNGRAFTTRFQTYLMEPSLIGFSTYVIGHSSVPDTLRSYKLERIQEARLLRERYQIPPDFAGLDILSNSWSIYFGEETTTVVLRFSPQVKERVLESMWHPSQETEDDPDKSGWLRWSASVSDTTDMLPWIRGWGAACEVLAPVELRELLEDEVRKLTRLYEVENSARELPLQRRLWAKTDRSGTTHPLLFHMIDVGTVTQHLWDQVLAAGFREDVSQRLGLGVDEAGRLLAFWAALHDIGKASPFFQRKFDPALVELKAAGLIFPRVTGNEPCYHAVISRLVLPDLLRELTSLSEYWATDIAQALGGHHGSWPTQGVTKAHMHQLGNDAWAALRRALVQELVDIFHPPGCSDMEMDCRDINSVLVLLSGLVSAADWLGSMQNYFPMTHADISTERYITLAQRRAQALLDAEGWTLQPGTLAPLGFYDLFDFEPRPLQTAVLENLPDATTPGLIIVEAPTGHGKTELALAIADHWMVGQRQRGMYVAMPTMATSNQMFGRVGAYLKTRYPDRPTNYHLIHSQAAWREDVEALKPLTVDEESGTGETGSGALAAASWFLPRKRTLLAPFAVGTVDQALMSVLQTRHFFVRLFGLSHKTLVFDEVHAYDTYMSTILHRLLGWLRAVGTSVVILSATLPQSTRRKLVEAYTGTPVPETTSVEQLVYPALTVASGQNVETFPLPPGDPRTIGLNWVGQNAGVLEETLRAQLRDGGCVAIICNRVARAQDIYRILEAAELVEPDRLILFHARFPMGRRAEIETQVLDWFGKGNTTRPHRAIVVATQVIEQSLDLDFDLMLSDVAPADLILQRAGRLHRHRRDARPQLLQTPNLLLMEPKRTAQNQIDWGGDEYVYEPYILLRSLLVLRDRGDRINIPDDMTTMIEAVYGKPGAEGEGVVDSEVAEALAEAYAQMIENEQKAEIEARTRLIANPDHEDLVWLNNHLLAEDRPEVHQSLQALTRLIQPTVSLVCLHMTERGLATDPEGKELVDLDVKPATAQTRLLVQCVVSVSHPALYHYFSKQDAPAGWRDHTLLHTHRIVAFTDGICLLEGIKYALQLSNELGLQILRNSE